jgi:hypothetical protein
MTSNYFEGESHSLFQSTRNSRPFPIESFAHDSMVCGMVWYVPNTVIRRDLQITKVNEEIRCYSSQYSARLSSYPNVNCK